MQGTKKNVRQDNQAYSSSDIRLWVGSDRNSFLPLSSSDGRYRCYLVVVMVAVVVDGIYLVLFDLDLVVTFGKFAFTFVLHLQLLI